VGEIRSPTAWLGANVRACSAWSSPCADATAGGLRLVPPPARRGGCPPSRVATWDQGTDASAHQRAVTAARLLARTIHGIEPVTADELWRRGLGQVERVRHREVWFTTGTPGPELLTVRTADDLFLLAAVVAGVGRSRGGLCRLAAAARDAPVERLLAPAAALRRTGCDRRGHGDRVVPRAPQLQPVRHRGCRRRAARRQARRGLPPPPRRACAASKRRRLTGHPGGRAGGPGAAGGSAPAAPARIQALRRASDPAPAAGCRDGVAGRRAHRRPRPRPVLRSGHDPDRGGPRRARSTFARWCCSTISPGNWFTPARPACVPRRSIR
jgi:hypothetical protein